MLTKREFLLVHFAFSSIFTRSLWILNVYIALIPRFGVCEVLVTQPCPTLCDPMDCSLPGSSVHETSQVRILEWAAIPFSRGSSQPRDQTQVSCLAGRFFTAEPPGKPCWFYTFYQMTAKGLLKLLSNAHPMRNNGLPRWC